ncbi:MAG: cytochrome c oxidase assembly protein [Actinobacteria bacterium]|nr:cytochrome c oxidase assembly protein [Actinomycetota bacterium]
MMFLAASLPTSGPVVSALSTVSKFLGISASIAAVGSLLAAAFLLEDEKGKLSASALRLRTVATWSSGLWIIAATGNIIFTLANILASPLGAVFDFNTIKSFVTQITLGQYQFFQLTAATFVCLFVSRIHKVGGAIWFLAITTLGIIAPIFQSHSATSGSHALAIGSLCIHVMALSLWVGGIFALALLDPKERAIAVPRFSSLALWAVIAVVVSGSANAWARLNFASAWHSSYAIVIIVKGVLTIGLIVIGYMHRKNLASKKFSEINWNKFYQLIMVELSIMIFALALGTWLASNKPPSPGADPKFNAAITVAGLPMPQQPTLSRILFSWNPDALFIGFLILAVALYVRGVVILRRRGDRWHVGRTVAFAFGIAGIDFATSGGFGVYAHFAFSYHMISHMILGMIAPIGLVLGAPITLALRTLPQGRTEAERGVRGTLISALHSRLAGFWVNPVVALLIFDGSLFGLYFTSLFGGMMQSHTGHFLMNVHFVLAGFLFFHVIIGIDPNPKRVPFLARIVVLFAAMSIHAFFSVALMSSTALVDHGYFAQLHTPWVSDLLVDQHTGGALGWAMGEIPILIALIATFIQWVRDDKRETKRIDRSAERLAAMGQPDELAEYNAYLATLTQKD